MRADRLVAALLLLQARGRITARELAEELEVSERTARRDLEALAMSGVPIYSQAGRGGGWSLIGGASTDLTGLTEVEARAVFVTLGTAATVTPALQRAARKLAQALPEPFRDQADRAERTTMTDQNRWGREGARSDDTRFLEPLQEAVLAERRIVLGYRTPGKEPTTRWADPLGLVAKAGTWYLIAGTAKGRRTFRVGRVNSVESTERPVERPDDFDLAEVWREIVVGMGDRSRRILATGTAEPSLLGPLRYVFGSRLTVGPRRQDGIHDIEVSASAPELLAGELAGFVAGVAIDGPEEITDRLAEIGRLLVERHGARR